jgi:alkaline phosphatase D
MATSAMAGGVFQGDGIKIGEVTSETAIIWTRLTAAAEAKWDGAAFIPPQLPPSEDPNDGKFAGSTQIPAGLVLSDMAGALPGAAGEVRVTLVPEGETAGMSSDWLPVDVTRDFTRQIPFTGLEAATRYGVKVESRDASGVSGSVEEGTFHTAPARDTQGTVAFVVVTCGDFPRRDDPANGHRIYASMLELKPDFFVHTGDIEYFDKPEPWANSPQLARFKWNRIFALPLQRAFHREVASFFMYDDHDILRNDCWPGQTFGTLTFAEGVQIFHEQTPSGPLPYRTVRYGKDLQIWLVEGRVGRSANTDPDGPEKTIWGAAQKEWFRETVAASDATFKVVLTPTPIVGPDRGSKKDNLSNEGFRTEGDELRRFIGAQPGMIVVTGDRHWQYASIDPVSGTREFGCGPSSDMHAGGYSPRPGDEQVQKFFRLKGGFLSVVVEPHGDAAPVLRVRHHNTAGGVEHESVIEAPAGDAASR